MKKGIIAIIIIAVIVVAGLFFINSKKSTQVAQVKETTIAQTTVAPTTTAKAEEPAQLTKDDLTINVDGKDVNLIDAGKKAFAAYDAASKAKTKRDVQVGDNAEKVWAKYGKVEIAPISRQDHDLWDYLKAHSDTDQRIKDALDSGDMYAKYVYHDKDGKDYAVGFWFDPENNVKWIFHYTEGLTTEAEIESAAAEEAKNQ